MALSPAATEIVKKTASVVGAHATDITKNFYARLFSNHRELFAFFNKSNQARGKQPAALADAVVAYASNIDKLHTLGPAVQLMAVKHCGLQVLPEHYSIVHDNLMESVAEVLGDAVTPEIGQGWSDAVNALAGILIDAEEGLYAEAEKRQGGWRGWREFSVVRRETNQGSGGSSSPIAELTLQPTDGRTDPFEFTPGQYLTMRFPDAVDEVGDAIAPRHYTITSAPGESTLQCAVKQVKGGVVSGMVHDQLHEGATVELSPPFGAFTMPAAQQAAPKEAENDVILVSAGIGITPMRAFARAAPTRIDRMVHVDSLVTSNPFHDELAQSGIRYETIETGLGGEIARMEDVVAAVIPPKSEKGRLADATFLLCGPDSFMADTKAALHAAGAVNVQYENFGPRTQL